MKEKYLIAYGENFDESPYIFGTFESVEEAKKFCNKFCPPIKIEIIFLAPNAPTNYLSWEYIKKHKVK